MGVCFFLNTFPQWLAKLLALALFSNFKLSDWARTLPRGYRLFKKNVPIGCCHQKKKNDGRGPSGGHGCERLVESGAHASVATKGNAKTIFRTTRTVAEDIVGQRKK